MLDGIRDGARVTLGRGCKILKRDQKDRPQGEFHSLLKIKKITDCKNPKKNDGGNDTNRGLSNPARSLTKLSPALNFQSFDPSVEGPSIFNLGGPSLVRVLNSLGTAVFQFAHALVVRGGKKVRTAGLHGGYFRL